MEVGTVTPPETQEQKDRQEYGALAMKAGDLQYKILCYQQELTQTNQSIAELNQRVLDRAKAEVVDGQG